MKIRSDLESFFLCCLAAIAIILGSIAVVASSLVVTNEIRKDQERAVCKKLGGRYTVLEECLAIDGKALVMPRDE